MDVLPYVSHYLQIIVYSQSWEYCHDKICKVYFQSLWVLVVGARCECSLRELVQFY